MARSWPDTSLDVATRETTLPSTSWNFFSWPFRRDSLVLGIPDIYEGRPEIGTMGDSNDPDAIATALEEAIVRLTTDWIEGKAICFISCRCFHEGGLASVVG